MAFNVAPVVPAITSFSAIPGVESATLSWDQTDGFPVQVRRDGVLVATVNQDSFVDAPLAAGVEVTYQVRAVRLVSAGDLVPGTSASASVTPSRAELGAGQVQTVNVAADAITTRTFFEEASSEYVQAGTDPNGNPVPVQDQDWTLQDVVFAGTGDAMVVSCLARQSETPLYFRTAQSSVYAVVSATILDVTGPGADVELDVQEMTVAAWRLDSFPAAPGQLIATGTNRDYRHDFIVATEPGHSYAVRFHISAGTDNPSNFILWATGIRQVFWQVYKR